MANKHKNRNKPIQPTTPVKKLERRKRKRKPRSDDYDISYYDCDPAIGSADSYSS